MKKCLIDDSSLRFARAIYGFLLLGAFLFHNVWLVLITAILMAVGILSSRYNAFYQLHYRFLGSFWRDKPILVERELNELRFACTLATIFLTSALAFFYLGKFVGIGWILVLIVSLLMLLAGLAGFCTASLMYAAFKKIFVKKDKEQRHGPY